MTPWEHFERLQSLLETALKDDTLQDVLDDLNNGAAHFWPGVNAVLVTRFDQEPEGKSLHVWLGAGDQQELLAMQPGLEAFGRAHGCVIATIEGRKGWERTFKERGFAFRTMTLGKAL